MVYKCFKNRLILSPKHVKVTEQWWNSDIILIRKLQQNSSAVSLVCQYLTAVLNIANDSLSCSQVNKKQWVIP